MQSNLWSCVTRWRCATFRFSPFRPKPQPIQVRPFFTSDSKHFSTRFPLWATSYLLASIRTVNRRQRFCIVGFAKRGAIVTRPGHLDLELGGQSGLSGKKSSSMAEQDGNTINNNPDTGERAAKKQYQEPAFRYEHVFETMALACGKVHPTILQCRFNRMNS
jgi:hypothetical protein